MIYYCTTKRTLIDNIEPLQKNTILQTLHLNSLEKDDSDVDTDYTTQANTAITMEFKPCTRIHTG